MQNTIHGLIKKRGETAGQHKFAMKVADALKADLDVIDRALVLCGYQENPKASATPYNWRRPHSALGNLTPMEFLQGKAMDKVAA